MALTDVLNSLSLQPAGTLTAQTGLPVSIGIVPDIAQLQLTNIELVDVDLDFIGKGVIFQNDDLSDSTVTGILPIFDLSTIPPSIDSGVQGLIGKLKGKFPVAVPAELQPTLDITWHVTDTAGNDLIASGDAIAPDGVTNTALNVLFLPEFVELTATPGLSTRRVSATVSLTAGGTTVGPRTLGPVDVLVPQVGVPTVLAMFVDKPYHGAVLIMIPGDSILPQSVGAVAGQIQQLQAALNPIRTLVRIASFITGLDALGAALANEPHISIRKTDGIGNLNDITLIQNSWYENDIEAEDELSSLLMIGPRGRAAEFFNDRDFGDGEGKFTLAIGTALYAGIRDLHHMHPASEPAGDEITVDKDPPDGFGWWSEDSFGDELSSVRFVTTRG